MQAGSARTQVDLGPYLEWSRHVALSAIRELVPSDPELGPALYQLVLDYPQREAKGMRPALCLATCGAFGGCTDEAIPSAAAIELLHNAFLVHDDIEDGSELRRGKPTLHRLRGVGVALNVGDAMLALALQPLLENTRRLDLGRALAILDEVADMARVTTEGQALELDWIWRARWDLEEADYIRMVERKTARYTFGTPTRVGALIAGATEAQHEALAGFARELGVAFQIVDDVLNLTEESGSYGKEASGDLWEGKRTLILIHALRHARPDDRRRALDALARCRPGQAGGPPRTLRDVSHLLALIRSSGSLDHARAVAVDHARRAERWLDGLALPPSTHLDVLRGLLNYVYRRRR